MQLGDQADRINGMLRAEKINMGNVAWLWKETNIWSGAACQSFDGCEKSSKKLYVLNDHPKALLAFPGTISLMLENILGEHKRIYWPKHKADKSKWIYFSKNYAGLRILSASLQCAILVRRRSKAEDAAKTIPPDTSCLGVREDRPPASEDAAGTWTASATASVRKGFDCGVDSWAASAAAKASEWTEEGQERKVRTWRRSRWTKTRREKLVRAGGRVSVTKVRRMRNRGRMTTPHFSLGLKLAILFSISHHYIVYFSAPMLDFCSTLLA